MVHAGIQNCKPHDEAERLLRLLQRPKTWLELQRAGFPRAEVFKLIDLLTAAGEIIVTIGPTMLERLDVEGDA